VKPGTPDLFDSDERLVDDRGVIDVIYSIHNIADGSRRISKRYRTRRLSSDREVDNTAVVYNMRNVFKVTWNIYGGKKDHSFT